MVPPMSTTTASPGASTRSDAPWCGLAALGPDATIVKSVRSCPSPMIASAMSAATSRSVRPGCSQPGTRACTRSMASAASPSAATSAALLRMRRSAAEVAALGEAADAIDRVHARVPGWLQPGRTEREVAADIADAIIGEGHDRTDFTIVASGPNAASPHHGASDRVLAPGDAVVVDIGGTMPSGYCSDCTRTYAIGAPPPGFAAYYQVLKDAQEAACAAVRPGVSAEAVDAAAREPIAAAGYGEHFIHRTGHGIGLECHEDPYIVAGNTEPLEPGMAFSIEPGIYPGGHGARIEDIVVCGEDGCIRLNNGTRELVLVDA